jgi:hypothetical protein
MFLFFNFYFQIIWQMLIHVLGHSLCPVKFSNVKFFFQIYLLKITVKLKFSLLFRLIIFDGYFFLPIDIWKSSLKLRLYQFPNFLSAGTNLLWWFQTLIWRCQIWWGSLESR